MGKTIEILSRMSLENIYKKISHAIFFIISMFFTIAMFLQFSEIVYKDILFVGLAIAIELLKNYLINDHNRLNFNMTTIKSVIRNYFEGEDTNA